MRQRHFQRGGAPAAAAAAGQRAEGHRAAADVELQPRGAGHARQVNAQHQLLRVCRQDVCMCEVVQAAICEWYCSLVY